MTTQAAEQAANSLITMVRKWRSRPLSPNDLHGPAELRSLLNKLHAKVVAGEGPRLERQITSAAAKVGSETESEKYAKRLDDLAAGLSGLFSKTHPYGYRFIPATSEQSLLVETARAYLKAHHVTVPDVRFFEACEPGPADFVSDVPLRGAYDASSDAIRIRSDLGLGVMVETLLHEIRHADQARTHGRDCMKANARPPGELHGRLEREADDFADYHRSGLRFAFDCRRQ